MTEICKLITLSKTFISKSCSYQSKIDVLHIQRSLLESLPGRFWLPDLMLDTPAAKLYAYIQALSPAVALPLLLTTAASLMDSPVAVPDVTVSFENSVSFPYIAMI